MNKLIETDVIETTIESDCEAYVQENHNDSKKKVYLVNLIDSATGAISVIDAIMTDENYTADMYISRCADYADDEWNQMIKDNEIFLEQEI